MTASHLAEALLHLARRGASAVTSRARVASPGFNATLNRLLSAPPGRAGSLLADPVFEAAKAWAPGPKTLGALSGDLLEPDLVAALASATDYQMARDMTPWWHQHRAWEASLREEKSVLVTSGTGSGKTECFLIPILNDILRHRRSGGGVQAILLYPLNALIESQRERLSAWAAGLDGRVRFALYNGDTPQTAFKAGGRKSSKVELTNRADIRANPPDILVTNITMLEYLLLREGDRSILQASQGALRWMVLDEAHGYVGSQAAEMALLLRRVRKAFGVSATDMRLMATSATIGGGADATEKLAVFAAALAGQDLARIEVVAGVEHALELGPPGPDLSLDAGALAGLDPAALWSRLAPHPRIQGLRRALSAGPVSLGAAAHHLWADASRDDEAQRVLDAAALAEHDGQRLLPWRAHFFHRAQGGVWACLDAACPARGAELLAEGAAWPFGALSTAPGTSCVCGAPVAEVVSCRGCGTPHLRSEVVPGAEPRLAAAQPGESDDFALDAEPEGPLVGSEAALIAPAGAAGAQVWIGRNLRIFDNAPPKEEPTVAVTLLENPQTRRCCAEAQEHALQDLRFGPAFFLANALPQALEDLAPPEDKPGLPAGGRKAISFTDSRQGVARLAAKLQQDAERNLARAFLYHAVQEVQPGGDPGKLADVEANIAKLEALPPEMQALVAGPLSTFRADRKQLLSQSDRPLPWPEAVRPQSEHNDLKTFAGEVWRPRAQGNRLWDQPENLARTFLFREMFRRPKVQNNPETMGLVRLVFPALEARIQAEVRPEGLTVETALGLAMTAIDMVFRDTLAVDIPEWMVAIVSPRFGKVNTIHSPDTPVEARRTLSRIWPTAQPDNRRFARLVAHVYKAIGGDPAQPLHQDRAAEVLDWLWRRITGAACRPDGSGYRLDFSKAAFARVEEAWFCPLTRRPIAHAIAGRSPFDPERTMTRITFPRLPLARASGLGPTERQTLSDWAETDPVLADLRRRGLWSDLHDRIVTFPVFIRAQEHSAQIARAVLKSYEARFNAGEINLLNCSTTMEMGVDLAAVRLVVNANVPPALSNYRQRIGRAGRRREPWAFGLTFCRDLPLDAKAFQDPGGFLRRPIAAPRVWLDSAALVQRHVNAALLGRWIAERGGMNLKSSAGDFLGAVVDGPPRETQAPVSAFLADLGGDWASSSELAAFLGDLVQGTGLQGRSSRDLVSCSAMALEMLVSAWRREFDELILRRDGSGEEAAQAFTFRAKRMAGEFLLGELARRGFTPAYGFPTDVVSFTPARFARDGDDDTPSFAAKGASRELHQAIREYAPGADVVIDGLVWQSEGVMPAWGADKDASKLEDLRTLWDCQSCHGFGVVTSEPASTCPDCGALTVTSVRILRPAGFLTSKAPHTGYESLAHSPFSAPKVSAGRAAWTALPDARAGRFRHHPEGTVVSRSSGKQGGGFAICLDCGRAEPMEQPQAGADAPLPSGMKRHFPLARSHKTRPTQDGYCPGGYTAPHRVQRHVHLAQSSRTDVFELQLPDTQPPAALALAAALRESLAETLGVESDEIGVSAGISGLAVAGKRAPVSLWLHDRAAGGAGLVARLGEADVLAELLGLAANRLACPEECASGCPACILQPDLSQKDLRIDRVGGLNLALSLVGLLCLPTALRVWGEGSRYLGGGLVQMIDDLRRAGSLSRVTLFLHGAPSDWDLPGWSIAGRLATLAEAGVAVDIALTDSALTDAGFDLSVKLSLHRLAGHARLIRLARLPFAADLPILSQLEGRTGTWRGVAQAGGTETLAGADWGAGATAPLIIGPMQAPVQGVPISTDRLLELGTGTGHVLTPGARLDGSATGFGQRFWEWIEKTLPLETAAMRKLGVAEITYSDRYLLTPVAVLLLAGVVAGMPGAGSARVRIDLAPSGTRGGDPWRVFDGFEHDRDRVAVLAALLPTARVTLAERKTDLPHRREFAFTLKDGRRYRLLFDQGFGAWRAIGSEIRHDFQALPDSQARKLLRALFRVEGGDEPLVWDGGKI